jgi:hypothetical protein
MHVICSRVLQITAISNKILSSVVFVITEIGCICKLFKLLLNNVTKVGRVALFSTYCNKVQWHFNRLPSIYHLVAHESITG